MGFLRMTSGKWFLLTLKPSTVKPESLEAKHPSVLNTKPCTSNCHHRRHLGPRGDDFRTWKELKTSLVIKRIRVELEESQYVSRVGG